MRKTFFGIFVLLSSLTHGQKITNFVLVGPDGVTQDADKAISFIVVKQYQDNHFERLDYKKGGPMSLLRSYKDSHLEILEGKYFKYAASGALEVSGHYLNNQKVDSWFTFNDTGKVVTTIKYDHDTLVVEKDSKLKDNLVSYPDGKEASFPGGLKAWHKYLFKSLEEASTADKAITGGKVFINFRIDIEGNIQDIFVIKSVEYIIDEESIEIIKKSPKWNPAFQNGKNVNAYRRQPITFSKQ